ncbi:hypothetical protein MMYC01_207649, partial [Madurella mycetomatis]
MSSVWARLAVLGVAFKAFAARKAWTSLANRTSETGLVLASEETDYSKTWTDPIPGTKALVGLQLLDLGRRDCLSNGSNYCFGNNSDFCPDCGNCCIEENYCCGRGKRATILIAQVETSTAVSTVDVTISSAATQTDVIWVTATAVAKNERAVAFEPLQPNGKHRNVASSVTRIPRQAADGPAPTITEYVTETFDITSVSSIIITASTTSTVVTTVYQTNTRVLNAQTTITITSTLTITSYPAAILTITTTASLISPTSSSPPQSLSSQPPTLPTPAIAGIATGGSILAAILGALVVLSIRRRRRRHHTLPPSYLSDSYYDSHHHGDHNRSNLDIHMREPTLPPLPAHFAPAVPAAHHAATYHLPMSYTGRRGPGYHRRDTTTTTITTTTSSTGQTTLVGGGMPGVGPVLGPKKEGEERDGYSYTGVAEVQGSEPTRGGGRVELEGSSPSSSSSPR